jgi:hypothetical protein
MTNTQDETSAETRLQQLKTYDDLRECTRNIRDNAMEADDLVESANWIAAGGRGTMTVDRLERLAEALRRTSELLEERVTEMDDPREVRDGE